MSHANLRTLDVDKIFVRDIFFKDHTNRPISANKFLLTRGDGGTFFGNLPFSTNSTLQGSFNEFRAGSNLSFLASNYYNTLWFESGAGITFYSTISCSGSQPKFWIASLAPEQLIVSDRYHTAETLRFEDLPDDLSGGRTLFFEGRDDLQIYISDSRVIFQSDNASTFSTINNLQSTAEYLYIQVSTILAEAEGILTSTGVSSLWSTLLYTEEIAQEVSTFVHSTFVIGGNSTLNITYPDVFISSLTVNELNAPLISTFSTIYWSVGQGLETTASSLRVSTLMGHDAPIFTFDMSNRRVGVNLGQTQQPRATVDVGGIVYADNFVTASDRRLKTDLEPLSFKQSIPSWLFTWAASGERDVGFMADEVEAVAPACVYTDDRGYKAVNYSKLVPYAFSMISDLAARVSTLEAAAGL